MPPRSTNAPKSTIEETVLRELRQDLGALVLAALLQQHAAGQHDVVAVAVHLDDAGFDLGAQVHVEILDATKVDQRCRQEAAQADIEDEAALDDFDNLARDHFAGLELLFDANPSTLVLGTLLGEDQAAVLVFLLENEGFDLLAQLHDVGRIGILADGQLARRDDALALEADVDEHLVVLDLDDRAVDQVALVELGQRAVDHRIHLLVGDVLEVDDGRVFDVGQNGPLSILSNRGPFVMITCYFTMFACARNLPVQRCNKHVSGAYITVCLQLVRYKP